MAVTYLTLYLAGQAVTVVEGSQLHLIYAAMGATADSTMASAGTPRYDPFPYYVNADELAEALAGAGVVYSDEQAVSAVAAAGTVAPEGVWNFAQPPTVGGQPVAADRLPLGSLAGSAADLTGDELVTITQGGAPVAVTLASLLAFLPGGPPAPVEPAAPTGLSVVAASPTQVDTTWSPVSPTATYDIRRNGEIIRTNRPGTTFNNTVGITPGGTFTYDVRAYEAATDQHSAWSEPRSVTTPTESTPTVGATDDFERPDAPELAGWLQTATKFGIVGGWAAPQSTTSTIALHPTPASSGNHYVEAPLSVLADGSAFYGLVARGPDTVGTGTGTTDACYLLLVSGAASDTLSIRRKGEQASATTTLTSLTRQMLATDVLRFEVEGEGTPTLRGYVNGAKVIEFTDSGGIQVPATHRRGGMYSSGSATAARFGSFTIGDLAPPTGTAPATPANLRATAVSPSRIDLAWDASPGADQYVLRRDGVVIATQPNTAFSDVGLTAVTQYDYDVLARNSAADSAWSAPVPATTPAAPVAAPATPTGLTVTVVSPTQVTPSWQPSPNATSYELEHNGTLRTGLTSTFVNDTVSPSSTNAYRVRARSGAYVSAFTALMTVTTPAAPTEPGPVPTGQFIFGKTAAQIKALPTSGAAWDRVKQYADMPISVDFGSGAGTSDQSGRAFAAGLVYVRTGDTSYKTKVVSALEQIRTYSGSQHYSSYYRQMAGWAFAADLVGHRTSAWMTFLDQLRFRTIPGHSRWGVMEKTAFDGANNHGTYARGSYGAISAFLGDTAALANLNRWQRFWLGDGSQPGISSHRGSQILYESGGVKYFSPNEGSLSLTWAWPTSGEWFGINPASAPADLEGAMPMDIYREGVTYSSGGGSVDSQWGEKGPMYTFTAGIGALVTNIVLEAAGYTDIWGVADNAPLRWRLYMHRNGGNYVHSHGTWMDHFLNKKYSSTARGGVTLPQTNTGRSNQFGFTDWLYP